MEVLEEAKFSTEQPSQKKLHGGKQLNNKLKFTWEMFQHLYKTDKACQTKIKLSPDKRLKTHLRKTTYGGVKRW